MIGVMKRIIVAALKITNQMHMELDSRSDDVDYGRRVRSGMTDGDT